jgi:hypothetical protein
MFVRSLVMATLVALSALVSLAAGAGFEEARAQVRTKPATIVKYIPPRPAFAGLHVGMSEDSATQIMKSIAKRLNTMSIDTATLIESDSIAIFGRPAYLQLQIAKRRVRTIVINFHPMGGGDYVALRDQLDQYLERYFGRGVIQTNESITYHRWETEDGTSEVSHSDKYMRIFVRLGKPRV